jgi:hypothetical protein
MPAEQRNFISSASVASATCSSSSAAHSSPSFRPRHQQLAATAGSSTFTLFTGINAVGLMLYLLLAKSYAYNNRKRII